MDFTDKKNALTERTKQLQNDIIQLICDECKARNIGGMFFQDIPIDKTYAVVDEAYDDMYLPVKGFQIDENGRSIYLMTENDYSEQEELQDELIDDADSYVFLTPEHADKFDDYFVTPIEDTFCPTDTLNNLLYTLQEMFKVLEDNGYVRIPQSIQLKELEETTYSI